MPDANNGSPFGQAVENIRSTTKWIIAAVGGFAAFIIGTDPLSHLSVLNGIWWWIGISGSFVSIALTVVMLALAVRVLASSDAVDFRELATEERYHQLRAYLEEKLLFQYPNNIRTIQTLSDEYDRLLAEIYNNPRFWIEDEFNDTQEKISDILDMARWKLIGGRFDQLMSYFKVAVFAIVLCIFGVSVTGKPTKETTTQPPISLTLIVNPPAISIGPIPLPPPSAAQLETAFDCGDQDQPYKVGPFVIGKTDLENGTTTVADLVKRLASGDDRRSLIGLLLIGSADKTPLSPGLAQQYGSSSGLAQARAEWVRTQLLESDALHRLQVAPAGKIAAVIAGPTQVGLDVDPAKLAIDRAVRVCVLWQQVKK
jgi:hypothetical protein